MALRKTYKGFWRISRIARTISVPLLICLALVVLYHELSSVSYTTFLEALRQTPVWRIACSLLATIISFLGLGTYDLYAVRLIAPGRVSSARAVFAGIIGNAISNTLGFHALTGGALRYRIYAARGLSAGDVARVVGLAGAGIGIGFVCVVTLSLIFSPAVLGGLGRPIGIFLLFSLSGTLWWLSQTTHELRLGRWSLPLPPARNVAQFMVVGLIEMGAAVMGLYILLPSMLATGLSDFVLLYVGAILLGIVSGAPGGIGIFETTMLAAFPAPARPILLAALLLYRLLYNILPFILSVGALLVFEHYERRNTDQVDGG